MSVSNDEVRHIATLARLNLEPERLAHLASELNGILAHVEALRAADTSAATTMAEESLGMPLRSDDNAQRLLASERASFAPAMRDGFFLVPRLSTHEDADDE